MVLMNTPLCNFGEKMHSFKLLNIDNSFIDSASITGEKGTLIMFICNHCPYVKAVIDLIVETSNELKKIGINSIAIMPNDIKKYPEDNFERMIEFANQNKMSFPYLLDENQTAAKNYGAVCTPDFFGFNSNKELNYRGRLIEMNNLKAISKKNELLEAMTIIASTGNGPKQQYPSAGCSIKWK